VSVIQDEGMLSGRMIMNEGLILMEVDMAWMRCLPGGETLRRPSEWLKL
jgi:hypothetical protein